MMAKPITIPRRPFLVRKIGGHEGTASIILRANNGTGPITPGALRRVNSDDKKKSGKGGINGTRKLEQTLTTAVSKSNSFLRSWLSDFL